MKIRKYKIISHKYEFKTIFSDVYGLENRVSVKSSAIYVFRILIRPINGRLIFFTYNIRIANCRICICLWYMQKDVKQAAKLSGLYRAFVLPDSYDMQTTAAILCRRQCRTLHDTKILLVKGHLIRKQQKQIFYFYFFHK